MAVSHPEKSAAAFEKFIAQNPDYMRSYMARYYSEKPEVFLRATTKRRAAKKLSVMPYDNDLLRLVEAEAFDLARCRRTVTGFKWHIDHMFLA